jgi:hypothetical protein
VIKYLAKSVGFEGGDVAGRFSFLLDLTGREGDGLGTFNSSP